MRTEGSRETGEWFTAKQIMARNGYTDEKAPDYDEVQKALLAGLMERDHEKPEMAKLKLKQYYVVREVQETASGSRKEDMLYQASEIEERQAEKLSKAFESKDFKVPARPKAAPAITLEPWKKDALDFQRKVDATTSRASKACQTAQSHILRLCKIFQASHDPLADANRCNLEEKMETLQSALKDFTVLTSGYSNNTQEGAARYFQMVQGDLEGLKTHCSSFEKVLSMSRTYLSTVG